ncbi:DNA-binding transcriptional MocR family regulator [Halanaerobium saccharolyticum]|uniref:DNA-binding transcriptional MocR family regulator n=1 Tax=Halanaerobium saccharolyticum TaxID=43595 RepID=A0A4R6LXL8_9FIRM|nr:GntR family transcriptional regulator [Halanaerobium saccharolyticum]TDO92149.1 DNA-binding transcriptional MocR family regulator [Halanaerobium saccharolyticum]
MFEIELNRDGEENLYTQIYEAIRAEILADKYTPDTKMPSIRNLASRLNVNAETVVKAYDLLAAENLIYKKEGSGSYIAPAAALKSNGDDQRLRILTSKAFSAPQKIIDFSGPENGGEFLEEFAWDLIFDRFYSEFKGQSFRKMGVQESSYFKLLQDQYQEIEKTKLYYSSEEQLHEILNSMIGENKELLFTRATDISFFSSFYAEKFKISGELEKAPPPAEKSNLNLSSADYDSLMEFLENNTIDYLIISDESVGDSLLDWSLSKLKSLLELAQMLKFKVIIYEYFGLYQKNKKIQELLESRYKREIILVQDLSSRVFPGLEIGLVYLETESKNKKNELNSNLNKYILKQIIKTKKFSAGDNLINNLLSYYLDHGYLEKRIKFLKQRLKNRKLLLKEAIKDHFRGVESVETDSLFYLKLQLNQEISQHDFKVFAEKNSILLPDYKNFLSAEVSNQLIISAAALSQFSIKQGVMALAKIYWQFVS